LYNDLLFAVETASTSKFQTKPLTIY